MNNSGFSGIPVLIIITLIIMPSWKIQKPHFSFSRKSSFWIDALLVLLILGHLALIIYPIVANAFSLEAVGSYYLGQINWGIILRALEAGIAEEWLMRFIIIALLIQIFKNNKYRILLIILSNAIIFGMFHLSNVFYQPISATLRQVIEVGGWALMVSTIYLYTHSLLLVMTYHGLYDFILFVLQGDILESGNMVQKMLVPTAEDWQATLIKVAVYALIALVIIASKRRRQVIKDNMTQMII